MRVGMLDHYADEIFGPMKDDMLSRLVPVDIRAAAQMFYEHTKAETFDWEKDFPTMAPPWGSAWYEWAIPSEYQSDGQMRTWNNPGLRRFGAHVFAHRIEDGIKAPPLAELVGQLVQTAHPGMTVTEAEASKVGPGEGEAAWFVSYVLFAEFWGRQIAKFGTVLDYIRPDGTPMIEQRVTVPFDFLDGNPRAVDAIGSALLPLGFAISLLHCKNTSIVDKDVPVKVQKARRRRGRPPKVVYKTLEIEPMKQALRTEGRVEEVGLKRALHICRGHFKDYRERGLFGRDTHKGIYWWESHVRGSTEQGVVVKDYKVNAPS